MAILIEEEKRKINFFALAVIVALVAIFSSAVYYIFFINPSSIEVIIPSRLKTLQETEQLKFDPNEVLNNDIFRNLKQQVAPVIPEPAFNQNPFSQ